MIRSERRAVELLLSGAKQQEQKRQSSNNTSFTSGRTDGPREKNENNSNKKKKKKRTRVSSNWIDYTGSNDQLNDDIKNGHQIKKHILHLCKSKGWCSYMETKEIFMRNCLVLDEYYNTWVQCKIRRQHIK